MAPDHCLDEHCVISLRKIRTQQAQAPLAAVRAGEEAVRGLREEVDAAERALHADLTISRDTLDDVMIGLDLWRQGLEAAIESEVVFEQATRPASGVDRESPELFPDKKNLHMYFFATTYEGFVSDCRLPYVCVLILSL